MKTQIDSCESVTPSSSLSPSPENDYVYICAAEGQVVCGRPEIWALMLGKKKEKIHNLMTTVNNRY